jgi:hypothetical protein
MKSELIQVSEKVRVESGTSGTLMSVAALSGGNRSVAADDTVELTYTFSAADDGA